MSRDTCPSLCTCRPNRGLACPKCWAPPPLIDPAKVAEQLAQGLSKIEPEN